MWNLIGAGAWLLLLIYLVFVVMNVRSRHLKMVVMNKPRFGVVVIDVLESLVFVVALYGMAWVTWLRPIDYSSSAMVRVNYEYHPLILQSDGEKAYYATVASGNGKQPVRYFTYWTANTRNKTNSRQADISSGSQPLSVRASAYPWENKRLTKLDATTEKAFVATMTANYRKTFLNGLGMHVGHLAERFDLIRIPNDTMIKVLPLNAEN